MSCKLIRFFLPTVLQSLKHLTPLPTLAASASPASSPLPKTPSPAPESPPKSPSKSRASPKKSNGDKEEAKRVKEALKAEEKAEKWRKAQIAKIQKVSLTVCLRVGFAFLTLTAVRRSSFSRRL
jgi:hypothetical protein